MKSRKQLFTQNQRLYSIFMLLALAWLTVCLPYVNESQQALKVQLENSGNNTEDSSTDNPLTNTTEEKTEGGTSLLSEYLHDLYLLEQNTILIVSYYKCHPSDLYLAYHPDLIIPPPEGQA